VCGSAGEQVLHVFYEANWDVSTAEYEFYQFRAPQTHDGTERNTSSTAAFLRNNPVNSLPSLTEGMFGYSITRPVHNQDYYYGIFDACSKFNCGIEGWHTESGPGVFEAVRPRKHL
jgi:glutamine synthetase